MSEQQESFLRGTLIRGIGSFYTAAEEDGQTWTLRARKIFRRARIVFRKNLQIQSVNSIILYKTPFVKICHKNFAFR